MSGSNNVIQKIWIPILFMEPIILTQLLFWVSWQGLSLLLHCTKKCNLEDSINLIDYFILYYHNGNQYAIVHQMWKKWFLNFTISQISSKIRISLTLANYNQEQLSQMWHYPIMSPLKHQSSWFIWICKC